MKRPTNTSSAQEIFDYVVNHLISMPRQSFRDEIGCVYRGPNGLMCAAGCLVTDDEYNPSMEGNSWDYVCEMTSMGGWWSDLIAQLQQLAHDPQANWLEGGEGKFIGFESLAEISEEFNLKYLVPA